MVSAVFCIPGACGYDSPLSARFPLVRDREMTPRRCLIRSLPLALALVAHGSVIEAAPGVGEVLGRMPFTEAHVTDILDGGMVTTVVHPMSDREIAVGAACLLNARAQGESVDSIAAGMWASPRRRVASSGEISSGDVEGELAPVRFPASSADEIARYLDAGPNETLNLSAAEIASFRALRANGKTAAHGPEVEVVVRASLARRYRAYRQGGVEAIAPYSRAFAALSEPGRELAQTLQNAVYLARYMPEVHASLARYPEGAALHSKSRFFWYVSSLKQRPSFALGHRVSVAHSDMSVVVERIYYVSHTLNSGQIAIALIPTREGKLFAYVSRVWSDELGGGLFESLKKSAAHDYLVQEMSALVEQLRICGE